MWPYIYVAVGGAIGSAARFWLMNAIGGRWMSSFPYATLAVNIFGSFVMGVLAGLLGRLAPDHQPFWRMFVGVGILGGFTTFSTFSLDMVTLIQHGEMFAGTLYALLSVILCILGLMLGLILVRALPL